ncbi:hypothetical protein N8I71_06500 [Roseibacterium sp. SDUM158016]|jgi:hypothetical protein|uniref:hypothetical protein n=1 Tax=Roseicyclus sediminis TaxID=2980997 RepID=UPI0021D29D3B|nr:hypothetical protein [Roseibacterium sp. SDUM158016]MCU4652474.1 hypothetical protein [Roseibacterium sp. SDUM158016]
MRLVALLLIAVTAVSACVGTPEEPELPPFTLDGNGIEPTISRLRIDFGRAQVGVIDTVSRLLREQPAEITTIAECGAGPMTVARWQNGLALNFVDQDFRGWVSSDPALPVAGGFTPGTARVAMPQVSFQVTSLGNEFNVGPVSGLLDPTETEIQIMWSGATCFFR